MIYFLYKSDNMIISKKFQEREKMQRCMNVLKAVQREVGVCLLLQSATEFCLGALAATERVHVTVIKPSWQQLHLLTSTCVQRSNLTLIEREKCDMSNLKKASWCSKFLQVSFDSSNLYLLFLSGYKA